MSPPGTGSGGDITAENVTGGGSPKQRFGRAWDAIVSDYGPLAQYMETVIPDLSTATDLCFPLKDGRIDTQLLTSRTGVTQNVRAGT